MQKAAGCAVRLQHGGERKIINFEGCFSLFFFLFFFSDVIPNSNQEESQKKKERINRTHQKALKTKKKKTKAIYVTSSRGRASTEAAGAHAAAGLRTPGPARRGASPGRAGEPLPKRSIDFRYLSKTFILAISFVLGNISTAVHALGRRAVSHPRIEGRACVKRGEIFSVLGRIKMAGARHLFRIGYSDKVISRDGKEIWFARRKLRITNIFFTPSQFLFSIFFSFTRIANKITNYPNINRPIKPIPGFCFNKIRPQYSDRP